MLLLTIFSRSMLFTPANRPERFEKAKELGADGIIIDLEDAISPQEKDSARQIVLDFLLKHQSEPTNDHFNYCVRVNSIKTPAGLKDLTMLIDNQVRPDFLVLPKCESGAEIEIINNLLAPDTIPIMPLIETAKGLPHINEIAQMPHVTALVFGGADYSADIGAVMEWMPLYQARAELVRACAVAEISPIDVPYLHLQDADDSGILTETEQVKKMGFTCKLAIHPKHIHPINQVMTPSSDEVSRAQRIVDCYDSAKGNASEIDGKMIDRPVYLSAKRVLALSKL